MISEKAQKEKKTPKGSQNIREINFKNITLNPTLNTERICEGITYSHLCNDIWGVESYYEVGGVRWLNIITLTEMRSACQQHSLSLNPVNLWGLNWDRTGQDGDTHAWRMRWFWVWDDRSDGKIHSHTGIVFSHMNLKDSARAAMTYSHGWRTGGAGSLNQI